MADTHYDVIIIGSGAGGGTLAYRLAPTGKKILILERGDYVPRERENWDLHSVAVDGRYNMAGGRADLNPRGAGARAPSLARHVSLRGS